MLVNKINLQDQSFYNFELNKIVGMMEIEDTECDYFYYSTMYPVPYKLTTKVFI